MNKKHLSPEAIIEYLECGSEKIDQENHFQECAICSKKVEIYRKLFSSPQYVMDSAKIEAIESALLSEMENSSDETLQITTGHRKYVWRMLYAAGVSVIIFISLFLLEKKPKKKDSVLFAKGSNKIKKNIKHRISSKLNIQRPSAYIETKGYQFRLHEEWKASACPLEKYVFSSIFGGKDHDVAQGICQTADGGYAVAGYSFSMKGSDCDVVVVKFDPQGRTNWVKTFGGKYSDKAMGIIETQDRGFLVCGYTESFNASGRDGWVIKLDSTGSVQWSKKYGGIENDILYAVRQTRDNGYLLAGYSYTGRAFRAAWILRLNSTGKQLWSRRYGGKIKKAAYAMDMADNGQFIISGSRQLPGHSHTDIWLQKMSPSGKIIWEYTWGRNEYDVANAVRIAQDGSCYIAGYTQPKDSYYNDYLIQKISSAGKMLWSRTVGFSQMDQARCLALSKKGYIAVAGQSNDPVTKKKRILVYSFNQQGKILWKKVYTRGFGDAALSMQATRDEGLIVSGYSISKGTLRKDIWLLKLDSNGKLRSD